MTAVVVPPSPEGAVKAWRKLVTAVRPGAADTFGIEGGWLDGGRAYELPDRALIVACDVFAERRVITVCQVGGDALTTVKSWERKAALGKSVCDWIGRRLAPAAASHKATALDAVPNRFDGRCAYCGQPVLAGEGRTWHDPIGRRTLTGHWKGACPPPPPPPERVEPNYREGPCARCGGWVDAGTGAAVLAGHGVAGRPRYAPVHGGDCPPVPAPGPANDVKGWCWRCGEPLRPGAGCWQARDGDRTRRMLACYPRCRPGAGDGYATWVCRVHDGTVPRAGDVIAARIDQRATRLPVPQDAPGCRPLPGAAGLAEIAGMVLDTATGKGGALRARVRACEPGEAAGFLAERAAAVAALPSVTSAFRARWTPAQYRDKVPWLAEVTGYDPAYGYEREFLRPERDWATGNAKTLSGLEHCWTLRPGRVYEGQWPLNTVKEARAFLRATAEGDVTEIGREEVDAWLALPPSPAR